MKKGKVLKYIILIAICFMSFFVFSSEVVNASGTKKGVNVSGTDIYLEVEQIGGGETYSIIGTYCGENNDDCYALTDDVSLTIPAAFEGNAIVSIADGIGGKGVLDSLKDLVNKIEFEGTNLQTIGSYAFYNFNKVDVLEVPSGVTYAGNYAFAMLSLDEITFTRYDTSQEPNHVTSVEGETVFGFVHDVKVVFATEGVKDEYFGVWNVASWSQEARDVISLTYKVKYMFCNGESDCEPYTYYEGEMLGNIRTLNRTGFVYTWISEEDGDPITVNDVAVAPAEGDTHVVNVKWDLAAPTVFTVTSDASGNTRVYGGKNGTVTVSALVTHALGDAVKVSYKWSSVDKGGINHLNLSNSNSYTFFEVKDSGTYKCEIILTYTDENEFTYTSSVENPYASSVEVEILKKSLSVSMIKEFDVEYGTYFKLDETSDFDEYISVEGLADGETIKTIRIEEYNDSNKNIVVGTYSIYPTVGVIGYVVDGYSVDYKGNYEISYPVPGKLNVVAKVVNVVLENDIVTTYGDNPVFTYFYEIDSVYNGMYDNLLNVTYEKDNNENVGVYDIKSVKISNTNYIANFVSDKHIIIRPYSVDVKWDESEKDLDAELVYDKEAIELKAYYIDLAGQKNYLDVSVVKQKIVDGIVVEEIDVSEIKNAAHYVATAAMKANNSNYELKATKVKKIHVLQAVSEFAGVSKQFTYYNGEAQTVQVALKHDEGGDIVHDGYQTCINAHERELDNCAITVSTSGTENYAPRSEIFYLHIEPLDWEIEVDEFNRVYGSPVGVYGLYKQINGLKNDEINIYYFLSTSSEAGLVLDVGSYNISDEHYEFDNRNYNLILKEGSGVGKLVIEPAPIKLIYHFYEGLMYTGKEHKIGVEHLGTLESQETIGLELDFHGKKVLNAGDYRIDATVTNDNYYISEGNYLEFSVAKATYDVSNIVVNDKEVKFNFKYHGINIEGKLPEGLKVKYTIDGRQGNSTFAPFKHTVVVSFVGDYENYNLVEDRVVTLYINFTWVWVTFGVSLGLIILAVGALMFLVKTGKIRIRKRVKRKKLYEIIKKNRQLDDINEIIRKHKEKLENENATEDIIVEDPVKFIKNHVEVQEGEILSLSFVDKLFDSEYGTKQFYSEVKNELLSYEGVVSKIKRDFETFYLNNIPIARFDVEKGNLVVGFALDPSQYRKDEYHHMNASKDKKFSPVPLKLKVNSIESLRHAKMFVRIIRKREKVKSVSNFIRVDYTSIYSEKDDSFKLFKKVFSKKNRDFDED